jgi:hypothetical protein
MWRRKAVALWTLLCCGCSSGAAGSFTIRSAGAVGHLELRYYLTGAFGGYGGFVPDAEQDGAYRIPLIVDRYTHRAGKNGTAAKSLKAILYAPGCQFSLLFVDLTVTHARSATFECRHLSTITLRGKILTPLPDVGLLDVEIRYLAKWDHEFFGFLDGAAGQFSVGKAPLMSGGRFQLDIPDFSKDGVTNQMQDAYLEVLVVEHSGGNLVKEVFPQAELLDRNVGLRILPSYDFEVAFRGR